VIMYKSILLIGSAALLISSCIKAQSPTTESDEIIIENVKGETINVEERLEKKIDEVKQFLSANNHFNGDIAILIDMRIPSNYFRFFVVDPDSMKVLKKGLVAHGSGSETGTPDSLRFSNIPNSYMTSLGKYRIGAPYIGSFGRSYKLHGLEPTNNKALERAVVFHRYMCVPDEEQPDPICNSLGCPMVSESFFEEVDLLIRNSPKPVLMEIYY
jgi:hypothetical protein